MVASILVLIVMAVGCSKKSDIEGPRPIYYPEPTGTPPPLSTPPRPGFVTFDRMEESAVIDAQALGSQDERENAFYLAACERYNQGEDLTEYEQGVNLGLNRLSNERFTSKVVPVGSSGCLFRADQDDYSLSDKDWMLIEKNTILDFETETTRGDQLQFLTQKRKPIIFGVELLAFFEGDEVADKGGQVYYNLVNQANNTTDFLAQQGINFQNEVDDEDALFSGFSQSQIALGKTRLITLLESTNGNCLGTFDTALGGDDLFQNPFNLELTQAGGVLQSNRLFNHAASEWICALPNGLWGLWRLNNAADNAEVEAPTNIVTNVNNAAIDAAIRIGDCNGCHYASVAIPFSDQIGAHIRNNAQFDQNEKRLGSVFFKYDRISAIIDDINRRNNAALQELGVTAERDPLTQTIFKPFRAEMNLAQIAAFTFLTPEEFSVRLRGTQLSSQAFGSLLNGGTVSLATLNLNFKTLVAELGLYADNEL